MEVSTWRTKRINSLCTMTRRNSLITRSVSQKISYFHASEQTRIIKWKCILRQELFEMSFTLLWGHCYLVALIYWTLLLITVQHHHQIGRIDMTYDRLLKEKFTVWLFSPPLKWSTCSLVQAASHHHQYLHSKLKDSRQEGRRSLHQSDEVYQNGSYLGEWGDNCRVELSHWSRSIEILCSDWLRSWYCYAKPDL